MAALWWRAVHVLVGTSRNRNDEVINHNRTLSMQNRCITIRELVEEVGIRIGLVYFILIVDFAIFCRYVSAKFLSVSDTF